MWSTLPMTKGTATVINVFYATDRHRLGAFGPRHYYGSRDSGAVEYGVCEVSVPLRRPVGTVTRPRWWRLEFRENLANHVVLLSAESQKQENWFRRLRESVNKEGERAAFVFVHGFNVGFEDAARRAAQLACDLKFLGVPLLYSWPSKASIKHYLADSTAAERSASRLADFLKAVVSDGTISTVHLIAHSLGCRASTFALEAAVNSSQRLLRQVIFAAPDVDVGVFVQRVGPIITSGERVTIYCSEYDVALAISQRVHQAPRLGTRPVALDGIDTVDASRLKAPDILGHSLFGDRSVVADVFELLTKGTPPIARFGMRMVASKGYYELLL